MSKDGHLIDTLIHYTMGAIVLIFALVVGVMVWSFIRHGRRHRPVFSHGSKRSVTLMMGSIGLIALAVDGRLFIDTLRDMNEVFWNFSGVEQDPRTVRIEINAHQWAWVARYAGPDGLFNTPDDVVTLDDVRVPVDAPVLIQLASTDVIHSFYLPNFRVKRDAVPGMINELTFEARDNGEFEIACAQHCGPNHYKMRGVLTVMPAAEFQAWLARASADARRAYDDDDHEDHWGWAWRSL